MKEINVLSLFDGMSGGQLALQKQGIKVANYFACEIDKHAIKVTQRSFPGTIQLGNVTKVYGKDLPKIDLLIGGSPCQGFSFAGKMLNFEDPRSKLFFEFVRLLEECKPRYFMLENVQMKQEHEIVISRYLGTNPIKINSALVSAQNRVRLYWTNINQKPTGLFGDMETDIPQPKDRGIVLKDILEENVADKYFLSNKMLDYFSNRSANFNNGKVNIRDIEGKASTITASSKSIDISDNFIKLTTDLFPSNTQEKADCLTAGGNSGGLHSDMTLIIASRGKEDASLTAKRNEYGKKIRKNTQQLEPRTDGKTNTLTSVQKDNLVFIQRGHGFNKGFEKEVGKCPSLTSSSFQHNNFLEYGKIRRLTPVECERLQTVPDNYTDCVSDTQRYKMLGNGWTIDVIAHIFSFMKLD